MIPAGRAAQRSFRFARTSGSISATRRSISSIRLPVEVQQLRRLDHAIPVFLHEERRQRRRFSSAGNVVLAAVRISSEFLNESLLKELSSFGVLSVPGHLKSLSSLIRNRIRS